MGSDRGPLSAWARLSKASARWRRSLHQQHRHGPLRGAGGHGHDLRLAHRVLHLVHRGVETLRQRVEILGIERRDERRPQGEPQPTLVMVGAVLGVAHQVGRVRVATGPLQQRLHALDAHPHLIDQHPEHIGRVGKEPTGQAHANHLHRGSNSAAPTAETGSVTTHERAIRPSDRPAHVATPVSSDSGTDDRGGQHLAGAHRSSDERRGQHDEGRAGLDHEPVDRVQAHQTTTDRAHDRPPAERRAERQRRGRREGHPARYRRGRLHAGGQEEGGYGAHRLLGVVGAVAERQGRRRHPLPRRHDGGDGAAWPGATPGGRVRSATAPRDQAEHHREQEGEERAEHPGRAEAVERRPSSPRTARRPRSRRRPVRR